MVIWRLPPRKKNEIDTQFLNFGIRFPNFGIRFPNFGKSQNFRKFVQASGKSHASDSDQYRYVKHGSCSLSAADDHYYRITGTPSWSDYYGSDLRVPVSDSIDVTRISGNKLCHVSQSRSNGRGSDISCQLTCCS
jgi:hypothetical protein